MNSRQLEYVLAVSETMSFSKAAKKLYVSQPSLSQYIKKVESEIGADIFVRTTPLKLTYVGEIFVKYANAIMNEEKKLETEMADISNNKLGKIRIGAGPVNSALGLPYVIERFSKEYPDISVVIEESGETELLGLLDSGEVDIVLTVMNPPVSDMRIVEEVEREQYVLVVPSSLDTKNSEYMKEKKENKRDLPLIDINECRHLPYIMQDQAMPAYIIFEELCRKRGFMPKTKVVCKNVNTAIQLAGRGIGACFVPSSITGELPQDKLHSYNVIGSETGRVIKIIYRKSMNLSQIHERFIEAIRMFYKDNPEV